MYAVAQFLDIHPRNHQLMKISRIFNIARLFLVASSLFAASQLRAAFSLSRGNLYVYQIGVENKSAIHIAGVF
jgi:hypothetical protein